MKRAYVDSCVWITRFEGKTGYKEFLQSQLDDLALAEWEFCTSAVVYLETLVKPLQQGQLEEAQKFRNFLNTLVMLKNYTTVFEDALRIAQTECLKALDAVHVALASHYHCDLFVSSDPHFRHLTTVTPYWIDLSGHAPSAHFHD